MESKEGKLNTKRLTSLTVTLAVAFLSLNLITLLLSSSLELYFSFQTQQQIISKEQNLIAQNAADTVKSFIQEKYSILKITADFTNLTTIEQLEQKGTLDKVLGHEPSFRQLVFLDGQNQKQLSVSRLSKSASGSLTEKLDEAAMNTIQQGKETISQVYIDPVTSEPMIVVTVPLKNVFGDFQGTLMAEVNLKFMWDLVGSLKIGKKGQAFVVNKNGDLLAYVDISRVLKGENLKNLLEVAEFVKGDQKVHVNKTNVSKGIKGNTVVTTHIHLGIPDWAVVVELPIDEAYETVIYQFEFTTIIVILVIILTVVIGFFLSKRITKPIVNLRDAAEKIREGNFETRIDIKSNDEIGQLASSFNQMTTKLKESYGILEKKVQERTKELEEMKKKLETINIDLEEKVQERTTELENLKNTLEQQVAQRTEELNQKVSELEHMNILISSREEKIKTILRTSIDGFWMTDLDGRFLDVNDAYCQLVGYSREELLRMKITDVEAIEKPEETAARIKKIMETGGDRFETHHRRKDGSTIDVEVSVQYTPADSGSLFVFLRDISQRKKAEEALKQHADELERMNKQMVGRELRMTELKNEIEELKKQANNHAGGGSDSEDHPAQ